MTMMMTTVTASAVAASYEKWAIRCRAHSIFRVSLLLPSSASTLSLRRRRGKAALSRYARSFESELHPLTSFEVIFNVFFVFSFALQLASMFSGKSHTMRHLCMYENETADELFVHGVRERTQTTSACRSSVHQYAFTADCNEQIENKVNTGNGKN